MKELKSDVTIHQAGEQMMDSAPPPSIYMAFLGTGNYLPCRYGSLDAPVNRYVQAASLRRVRDAVGTVDHAFILCTAGAKARHWDGLRQEFRDQGLPEPECVDIDDAFDESGMWRVFKTVVERVPKEARLFFDATHSFRSLSIIMTVMFNYLKVAKQVEVQACYYGVWEAARDRNGEKFDMPREASAEERECRAAEFTAPLIDLRSFLALNDWTTALGNFLDYGDAAGLVKVAKGPLGTAIAALPDTRRRSSGAVALKQAISGIDGFCRKVRLAYLGTPDNDRSLVGGNDCSSIVQNLQRSCVDAGPALPQLEPLLRELEATFHELDTENETEMGLNAATWAAWHGMIPQAYTFLRETIVSGMLAWLQPRLPALARGTFSNLERRSVVSTVLAVMSEKGRGAEVDWRAVVGGEAGKYDPLVLRQIADLVPPNLPSEYASIKQCRNVLNHAGTNECETLRITSSHCTTNGVLDKIERIRAVFGSLS